MQDCNFTQSLKDQGLRTPSELNYLYDVDGQGGGRIVRDKLWFYLHRPPRSCRTTRSLACGSTRTPTIRTCGLWISTCRSQPLPTRGTGTKSGAHVAGFATPQAAGYWQEQHNYIGKEGGGTPTQTPEGTGLTSFKASRIQQPPGRLRSTTSCWRRPGLGPTWGFTTRAAVADRASAVSAASTTRR